MMRLNRLSLTVAVCGTAAPAFAQGWTAKAAMPSPRTSAACVALDGVVYVMGGSTSSGPSGDVLAYDPAADSWSGKSTMPGVRYQPDGAAELDGRIYFTGGWTQSPPLPNSNLWAYDPRATPVGMGSWTPLSSYSTLTAQGGSAVIDGKLYVTTAADGFGGYRNTLYVYDPATNAWSARASSGAPHANAAFGAIRGRLYLAGGWDANGQAGSTTEEYNPATDTWAAVAPMPSPRVYVASAVLNGKLYVAGGTNGTSEQSSLLMFDPVSNTWTLGNDLPTSRVGPMGAAVNGTFYVIGGSHNGVALSDVLAYGLPCYANCDNSSTPPILNVGDFTCFLQKYAAGCGAP
jgi:N-acetylneuraminic acid mutarotase